MNLDKDIINSIVDAAIKYEIDKIVLFGSRARGDNDLKSDIDLAVYSNKDIFEFIEDIENNAPTLLEFDFSDMKNISDEFFINQVENDGVILYEKHWF